MSKAAWTLPHNGFREMARRREQMAKGQIYDHYKQWGERRASVFRARGDADQDAVQEAGAASPG
jgi:hypothetical protein